MLHTPILLYYTKFIFFSAVAPVTEPPIALAVKCDQANCDLPHCFCSKDGTIIPGGIDPSKVKYSISKKKNLWRQEDSPH